MEQKPKILVADDELAMRRAFRRIFENDGCEVVAARDGAEAVSLAAAARPDAILLDVMMPVMNGIDACAAIRKADPAVPVIFFTAMPSDETLVRGLGLGADDYIAKDRPASEFIARVRAAIGRVARVADAAGAAKALRIGSSSIDLARMSMSSPAGEFAITRAEAIVLAMLAGERGRFVARERLALHLGSSPNGDFTSVRTAINRLKTKLGRDGNLVVNAYGRGYKLLD